MTTTQLGFEKVYKTVNGEMKKVVFEAVTSEADTISLEVVIDSISYRLQNTGDHTSSLDKVTFTLPFEALYEYGNITVYSNKVYYRELRKWKQAIEALKEFGISPIYDEVVRLVTYANNPHEDLEFEVSKRWLMGCLQRQALVEHAEDYIEVFLHTYTHDDSFKVYLDAKENQQILKEEIYC